MKTIVTVLLRSALSVLLMSMLTQVAWADARANYEEKLNISLLYFFLYLFPLYEILNYLPS